MRRFRPSLAQALFLSLVVMGSLTLGLVWLTYARLRDALEAEVGVRLAHTARLLAAGLDGALIAQFRAGDETLPAYQLLRGRLAERASLAGVETAVVAGSDRISFLDADPDRRPGTERHRLLASVVEVDAALAGEATASRLYVGEDGRHRLSAFAPVRDGSGRVRAVLIIDAPSQQFSSLTELRRQMWGLGLAGFALAGVTGLVLLRQVQGRLRRLRETVVRTRRGDLTAAIEVGGLDEIAALGEELDRLIGRMAAIQSYLETVLGGLGAGLIAVDEGGGLRLANPRGLSLAGLSSDDVGQSFRDALKGQPRLQAFLQQALDGGEAVNAELTLTTDGVERVVAVAASRIEGGDGGVTLSLLDVTEVRDIERKARANERLATLGSMAGGLLHEIRNPLSSIMVYLDLLKSDDRPSEAGEILDRALEQTERLAAFLEDFQVFAGLKPLRSRRVDLRAVAEAAAASLRWPARVENRGVTGPSLPVRGDSRLLEHAVRNLLQNSVEALARGSGGVAVFLEQTAEEAIVAVCDDGPGPSLERLSDAFDPLYTTKVEGSGLGLTVVDRVAAVHGGVARVLREEGVTRFEIRLPMAEERSA